MKRPSNVTDRIEFTPIGILHSPYRTLDEAPRWGTLSDEEAVVEVFEEYVEGLDGIERYTHLDLLLYFHQASRSILKVKPPHSEELRGVFAARSPHRPNPIGLTTVRLVKREGRFLTVTNVDAIDGTPVLDIKPHKD